MTEHDYSGGQHFDVTKDEIDLHIRNAAGPALQSVAVDHIEIASVDGENIRVDHIAPDGENVRTLTVDAEDLDEAREDWLSEEPTTRSLTN